MQQLMKSMREATMSSGMLDNSGTQLGTEMLDTQYANKMSGLPGGLAAAIARQLERQLGSGAAAALAAPAAAGAAGAAAGRGGAVARGDAAVVAADRLHPHAPGRGARRRSRRAASRRRSRSRRRRTSRAGASARSGTPTARRRTTCSASRPAPGWSGPVAEITTTEYVGGEAQKVTAKFRAYASYGESFRDYARLMKESPRYAGVVAQAAQAPASAASAHGFAQGLQRAGYATDPAYADKLAPPHQHDPAHAEGDLVSISSLLSIGSRAMTANYAALQTTGNNIANANTAGYSRQTRRAGDGVQPADRLGLLRQGRRRRDGDPRAQRLPDPRGGDDRLARRRRRGAQQPAAAARDGLPDRRGGPRLRRAADVQRLRRRLATSRRTPRRGRSCWPASATSPRAFAAPPTRSIRSRPASPRTCARRSPRSIR